MRKLLLAASASLAALALPAAPAQADPRDGVRVGVSFGIGHPWARDWRHPRWRGHWRDRWRWRDDWRWRGRWHRPVRIWRSPGWAWGPRCRAWWWDGWTWRCRW